MRTAALYADAGAILDLFKGIAWAAMLASLTGLGLARRRVRPRVAADGVIAGSVGVCLGAFSISFLGLRLFTSFDGLTSVVAVAGGCLAIYLSSRNDRT